jgi:hypothetical protein
MSRVTLPAAHAFSSEPSGPELAETFQALAEQWYGEAGMLSNPFKKFMHVAYQQIIGLGPRVVPLLLDPIQA